jgi:hypothetical protein
MLRQKMKCSLMPFLRSNPRTNRFCAKLANLIVKVASIFAVAYRTY